MLQDNTPVGLTGFIDETLQLGSSPREKTQWMNRNVRIISLSGVISAVVAGIVSGVHDYCFLKAILVYVFITVLALAIILGRDVCRPHMYFPNAFQLLMTPFTSGFLCFILLWILFYDIVHIFDWSSSS